jgi:hypothetical protein
MNPTANISLLSRKDLTNRKTVKRRHNILTSLLASYLRNVTSAAASLLSSVVFFSTRRISGFADIRGAVSR